MKLDSISSFCHNLNLASSDLVVVGFCGSSHEELLSLAELLVPSSHKLYQLPDCLAELGQMSLFAPSQPSLFTHVEKLKKQDMPWFVDYLKSQPQRQYLISTSQAGLAAIYAEFKNQMLVLDLSQEKPWQKKDRYAFVLNERCRQAGYVIDRTALGYLIDNENSQLDRAATRLESCMLLAEQTKKITLDMIKSLLPEAQKELDFAWIDQLLFKNEPLAMPECQEASSLLMFLGQLRYVLINALKMKSLQASSMSQAEMKPYFPKLSPQALSFQLKKIEESSFGFLKQVLCLVYDKEMELKHDFHQPAALFIELIAKIRELKTCPLPVS